MHLLALPIVPAMLAVAFALASPGRGAAPPAASEADPAKGKQVFARCVMCHDAKPGINRLGPSLAGIVGRKAGSVAGFKYSSAMKNYGKTWSPAALDAYLASPAKTIPGNRMAFAGVANAQDRTNLVAYLKGLR